MVTLATYARVILLTLAKPSGECYRLGSFHDGRDTGAGFGALVGRGGPGGRAETLSSTSASNAAAGIKLSSGASDEVASSHWGVNVQLAWKPPSKSRAGGGEGGPPATGSHLVLSTTSSLLLQHRVLSGARTPMPAPGRHLIRTTTPRRPEVECW